MIRVLPLLGLLLAACSFGPKPANSDPVPPSAVELERPAATVTVDARCAVDADCTVKNVGNCCGYFPACVNVDAAVDPDAVKAQCAKEGRMSTCGFREIAACRCKAGTCEAADSL
ncbi:MAG TPA: hypothetical protein VFL14_05890 [Xanthomonadales bacterium]|nr:hypothetical protein [Xanthomonadales bacterium]